MKGHFSEMKRLILLLLVLCSTAALATVTTQNYTATYTCTGGYGPFQFTFPISEPAALTVNMNGVLLAPTSYTIVPVNNDYSNGGSVTLGGSFPCTGGWIQILTRVTPITQTISFYDNMPIPMKTFERALDKLTEIAQESWGNSLHSIQLQSVGANVGIPMTGYGVLNFDDCTVTPTIANNFTVDCPGTGGFNSGSPPPIGNVTPNTGTFTTLIMNSLYANGAGAPAYGTGQFQKTDATQNGGTNAINTLTAVLTANPSGSTQNWAKNAIQGYCQNKDTTSVGTFQDCIGVLGAGQLFSGNTVGRVFGLNGVATIDVGADGTAAGLELDIVNHGSVQNNYTGSNPKFGAVIVSAGPNHDTAGLLIGANVAGGGGFRYGVVVKDLPANGIPFSYAQTNATTCSATGAGSGATCTLTLGSTDLWGTLIITAGTGASATGTWTLTFSQALGVNPPVCVTQVTATTWNARASFIVQPVPTTAALVVNWDNNSVALSNAAVYYAQYHCQAD